MNEGQSHSLRFDLASELEAAVLALVRGGKSSEAIKKLVDATGCPINDAEWWLVEHSKGEPTPCPHCGKPLATDKARQCFSCGMDWHDPDHVVRRGDPDWNRFDLKKGKVYVVQLCQAPDGYRYTKYREVGGGEPDPYRVFETEPAPGLKFIGWGSVEHAKHLRLSNGEMYYFFQYDTWLTEKEYDYLGTRSYPGYGSGRKLAVGEEPPWVNGISPRVWGPNYKQGPQPL